MIKFFRKIRQRLLSQNKISNYLIYALGEIVLVVVGILIALSINNWNENEKAKADEQQYLLALKDEFKYNKKEIERVISLNNKNIDYSLELSNKLGPGPIEMTEKEFGRLASGSLSVEAQFNPSQGVLDEIISSGKLTLISNVELKFSLSTWSGIISETRLQEYELHRIRFNTIDIIRIEGNLRRAISGPGLEKMGIKQSNFEKGNLHLLKSLPFEGHLMGFVTMSMSLNQNEYLKISEQIDKVLQLINNELV